MKVALDLTLCTLERASPHFEANAMEHVPCAFLRKFRGPKDPARSQGEELPLAGRSAGPRGDLSVAPIAQSIAELLS
jgi:hypothetical protein